MDLKSLFEIVEMFKAKHYHHILKESIWQRNVVVHACFCS